jgi:hypothetical protein
VATTPSTSTARSSCDAICDYYGRRGCGGCGSYYDDGYYDGYNYYDGGYYRHHYRYDRDDYGCDY